MRLRLAHTACFVTGMLIATTVWGVSQARVLGTVTDTQGEPVPGAVITVTSPEQESYEKTVEVDKDGEFKFLLLDATKTYVLSVEAPGYMGVERQIKVGVGTMNNVYDFTLETEEQVAEQRKQELLERPGFKELKEGTELERAGELEQAAVAYRAAVTAKPDLLPALEALTEVTFRLERYQEALEAAEACLEEDPESVACLAVASNVARELGLSEDHEKYMARYERANPDDPATLFNRAVEHLNEYDDASARPLLEECLEVDPEYPKCLFEYGMLLLRADEVEKAKEQFETYLEVAPEGEDAATARETVKYL